MIAYENGPEAMDWLARVFGFRERTRMLGQDGRLSHGEMETGGGMIMLATPSPHYHGPKRHREESEEARRWSEVPYVIDGVLVYVDDVRAHFERARAAGATILSPVEEGAESKRYRAEDIEGHRWMFIQRVGPIPGPRESAPSPGFHGKQGTSP
jgi:uncharacterized glyoxalase superfamily protein PhnB